MNQETLKIARHESGHAVMALILNQEIQELSMEGMDSPSSDERYLAFMKLKPKEDNKILTGEKVVNKIMISLGGYASEVIFYDGWCSLGGDDLKIAIKNTEILLEDKEFKYWVNGLPVPEEGPLDMISNPLVRSYVDLKINECIHYLNPHKSLIDLLTNELIKKEKLNCFEIKTIFETYKKSLN